MNIYVGNVPYAATEADLEKIFEPHGPIKSVTIIRDRHDGRSKGYGFVEMENQEDGERATEALDGHELMGRRLTVNPARPRQDRAPSRERQQHGDPNTKQSDASDSKKFHNPYTFVPSPPRQEAIKQGGFAGDFNPLECGLDHASLKDNLWTGHIPIKLTTVTPLVLLKGDGEDRSTDTHQTYDVLDYLPESSLRGMLRSAYEVVTNSRYACFRNDDRLAYRMDREKRFYDKSPKDLLDGSLKPAKRRCELSPADRLFGWVPQSNDEESQAKAQDQETDPYKSRIRVVCEDGVRDDIIKSFGGKTLPLTILGEPKPAQGRFYVAEDSHGTPQADGLNKEQAGYSNGKGLRGRKWYWHHNSLEANNAKAYWQASVEDRTQKINDGRYQEYRRPNDNRGNPQKDKQNCSITGWIKPGTEFKVSLYVQNLEPQEVGALLWLLSLNGRISDGDEKHYFRLGYGKPLGFGSVKMEIDCSDKPLPLGTGQDWKEYYTTFDKSPHTTLDTDKQTEHIQKYQENMKKAYPDQDHYETGQEQTFNNLRFISGFLQVLLGPKLDAPIHYPRLTPNPQPKGENFRWFTANENGTQLALPAVTDKKRLPYKP